MKYNGRYLVGISIVFAALLPLRTEALRTEALNARDADPAPLTLLAVHSAKHKCMNTCRARYRDCLSQKQIYPVECRAVYQDCAQYTCTGQGPG
jgi:hypothetical protein